MSNTERKNPTAFETELTGDSTLRDVVKSPFIAESIDEILLTETGIPYITRGPSRNETELNLMDEEEKLRDIIKKKGTSNKYDLNTLTTHLLRKYDDVRKFSGNYDAVISFLIVAEELDGVYNEGLISRWARYGALDTSKAPSVGEVLAGKENPFSAIAKIGLKDTQGEMKKAVDMILNMTIEQINSKQPHLVKRYKRMFDLGFAPVNELGNIVTPHELLDVSEIKIGKGDGKEYIAVASKKDGDHYINQRGEILKIGGDIVKKIAHVHQDGKHLIELQLQSNIYFYLDEKGKLKKETDVARQLRERLPDVAKRA